jgi:hypothetical protein
LIRSILDKPVFELEGDVVGLTGEVSRVPEEVKANAVVVAAELWPASVLGSLLAEVVAVGGMMKLQKDEKVLTASIPAFEKDKQVAARLII